LLRCVARRCDSQHRNYPRIPVLSDLGRAELRLNGVLIPFRIIDGIMECMPKILYSQVIEEDSRELKELEKHHRYTHLFQRVRMLRLLKSEECRNLGEAAEALGYSWRQCQRWFASYRKGGLEELLRSRVSERGRQELVTEEAFQDLEEAMKRGEIATISEAEEFLRLRHGIEYSHPDGVGQLLRRRKVKLKTGRPRHEKADPEEQEAFKKTSRTSSGEAEHAIAGSR
jgi:transposase